jgi:hypothetical protein
MKIFSVSQVQLYLYWGRLFRKDRVEENCIHIKELNSFSRNKAIF